VIVSGKYRQDALFEKASMQQSLGSYKSAMEGFCHLLALLKGDKRV
jgi:hypothetical protein